MALDTNAVFQARCTPVGVAHEHERVDWDFSIDGLSLSPGRIAKAQFILVDRHVPEFLDDRDDE